MGTLNNTKCTLVSGADSLSASFYHVTSAAAHSLPSHSKELEWTGLKFRVRILVEGQGNVDKSDIAVCLHPPKE